MDELFLGGVVNNPPLVWEGTQILPPTRKERRKERNSLIFPDSSKTKCHFVRSCCWTQDPLCPSLILLHSQALIGLGWFLGAVVLTQGLLHRKMEGAKPLDLSAVLKINK